MAVKHDQTGPCYLLLVKGNKHSTLDLYLPGVCLYTTMKIKLKIGARIETRTHEQAKIPLKLPDLLKESRNNLHYMYLQYVKGSHVTRNPYLKYSFINPKITVIKREWRSVMLEYS